MDEKARAIAAYLQSRLCVGERVLLVYPQGLEAIAAFFGCLYAGVVAIPAPAPEAARMKHILLRLEAIASDARLLSQSLSDASNKRKFIPSVSCIKNLKKKDM
ncbi:AMP-binding protein [Nostoc sp. C052]|uniref:AMP-binding protein n=1 Tax=Nostoc sp. C052 TaxID=2576902 RepID=UPI00277B5C3B|nr:AMP-binding protein [Nostoc sp. C052]